MVYRDGDDRIHASGRTCVSIFPQIQVLRDPKDSHRFKSPRVKVGSVVFPRVEPTASGLTHAFVWDFTGISHNAHYMEEYSHANEKSQ